MGDYYITITDAGAALEASAHAAGQPVALTAFGVCDGGVVFTPDPAQTALANEVYRGDISSLSVSADDTSVLEAQCIIPASSGGYTIRGIGLYAGDTLYAVGNYPDQPKPAPDSGYAASLEVLAQLAVSDTADVTLHVTDGSWMSKAEADRTYVPLERKINGHPLSEDTNITSQDIYDVQAIELGDGIDLNTITTPGIYYQPWNRQAASGQNYPEDFSGSLIVEKHAGITQIYRLYNNSRQYARTLYGSTWSVWALVYDTQNKPSADDVGAYSKEESDSRYAINVVRGNVGEVGTYAFLSADLGGATGVPVEGSTLYAAGVGAPLNWSEGYSLMERGGAMSGTWICCGRQPGSFGDSAGATLYYRIA